MLQKHSLVLTRKQLYTLPMRGVSEGKGGYAVCSGEMVIRCLTRGPAQVLFAGLSAVASAMLGLFIRLDVE